MSKRTTRLRALGALVGIAAVAVTAIAVTGASAKPAANPYHLNKEGTLTVGMPMVSGVMPVGGFAHTDVLRLAASVERASGHLLARIHVGAGPHGLCVWPQPGRYSLGHTGVLR